MFHEGKIFCLQCVGLFFGISFRLSFVYVQNADEKSLSSYTWQKEIQSTLVISKSKGPSKRLRDVRTSTYQMCSSEEITI